jgi:ABC-type sugar transport system substrate-binding protein
MKKFVSLAVVLLLAVALLTACGGSAADADPAPAPDTASADESAPPPAEEDDTPQVDENEPAQADDDSPLRVAGVVFQEDQFMRLVSLGYQRAAEDFGVEVNLVNTNGDTAREMEMINTFVAQGFDGIAICPINETTSVEVLRAASEEGGVYIAVSNLELNNAPFIVGGYTSNQYDLTVPSGLAARAFIEERLENEWSDRTEITVAMLGAESVLPEVTHDRWNGFLDQITDIPGIEIRVVAQQDGWLQDEAMAAVDGILAANPDLDIFFGFNDGSTIGGVMAIRNAGRSGETFVFGTDASEQVVEMLQSDDNILQFVTGQDPFTMGYNTMALLIRALQGEDYSATQGVVDYVGFVYLERGDEAGLTAFLDDLAEKMQ